MPFLLYRRQPDTVSVRYERLQPLRVGGPDGVIARFVKTLQGRAADAGWEVASSELIRLAGLATDPADQAILFEVPADEPGTVCFYQLHRVCGQSRDRRTQLSLDLEVLVDGPVSEPVEEFRRAFQAIYASLAEQNATVLVPFLLEGIGADPAFNQPDLIHPTARGQSVIAATVWKYLRSTLE